MTYAYRPTADRVHEQVALYEANPVMRIKDGDTYVAVASNGGASSTRRGAAT
jgi:hypothetical protein